MTVLALVERPKLFSCDVFLKATSILMPSKITSLVGGCHPCLSAADESLNYVRNVAQGAAAAGLAAVAYFSGFDIGRVFGTLFAATFLLVFDQVGGLLGGWVQL